MAPRIHRLANGVRVICDPIPGWETVALSVVAGRGARSEDKTRSGWSHLLEHMVFKGAGERSARQIVEVIEAQGGHINAATGYERTSFQVRALKDGLDLGCAVLSDLVLRPIIAEDDLVREKDVVAQEIAEAADAPDDLVFELAQAMAFASQPLGRPILGTPRSIAGATPQTLEAWRAALYRPQDLVISVSGAVDEDALLKLAERDFSAALPAEAPPAPAADFTGGGRTVAKQLEQASLVLLLPTVGARDPNYFTLRLLTEILGGGMASRLFQEAREVRGLAYAIDAFADTFSDIGVLGIFSGCASEKAVELAQVTAEQIQSLTSPPGEPELARAKAQLKGSLFMGRESAQSRAEQAAGQALLFDEVLDPSRLAELIDAVSPSQIADMTCGILGARRAAMAVLGPRRAHEAADRFQTALFG